jgi:3-phosphoshikimate 1-carboxyvinyltransferase
MTSVIVHPSRRPLVGGVSVPSDAAIARAALIVGALSDEPVRLGGFSRREDDVALVAALGALGVAIDGAAAGSLALRGRGLRALREPSGDIDCGGSAALMRLLCGVLAAQPFPVTLAGDVRLAHRGMLCIAEPLRARGARVEGRTDPEAPAEIVAPLRTGAVPEGRELGALELGCAGPSPDVKGAMLLSGLYATGITRFAEPTVSQDHVERLMTALGAPLRSAGPVLELDPTRWDRRIPGFETTLPGDLSIAVVLLAAAQMVEGSCITVRGVGTNPTRSGWLEMARDLGAGLGIEPKGERLGEPLSDLHAWSAPLHAAHVGGETLARALDELPWVCALAARASGTTRIFLGDGAREAQAPSILPALQAFGVVCAPIRGGLEFAGNVAPLVAADVDSRGDPGIAMASVVLGLAAGGPTRVRDAGCIAWRYPKLVATLRGLGARIDVET